MGEIYVQIYILKTGSVGLNLKDMFNFFQVCLTVITPTFHTNTKEIPS